MPKKETINAIQIAVLAGAKADYRYAYNRTGTDPTFPRAIIEQKGIGKSLWFKHEIVAWLQKNTAKPKAPVGRQAAKLFAAQRDSLDAGLAQHFLRTRRAA
ncbi:MAG: hypothetical protein ACXWT1_05745 [Methylobacter sp.]